MCIILFAFKYHPRYRLILAANRDEYYARPTEQAGFWAENPDILAGRDLEKMGTWLGITKTGRFAALTNYRDPGLFNANSRSRGELVKNYLQSMDSPPAYLNNIQSTREFYNSFNIMVGDLEGFWFYSKQEDAIRKISPGIYGLSNHLLNTPWPKVIEGKKNLANCLRHPESAVPACLFHLLRDSAPAPDSDLPHTGVSLEWERILSPVFISSPDYGTRSSTLILIDYTNHVTFMEKNFIRDGHVSSKNTYKFDINLAN